MCTIGERACGSSSARPAEDRGAKRHPAGGRGLAPNANEGGGRHAPTTRRREWPVPAPRASPRHFRRRLRLKGDGSVRSWGVDRRQAGCSSSSSPSRECSTSTQHEGAPRVPMRLARGTSRPESIVARQATSRVAVTAEHGFQHLPTDSQAGSLPAASADVLWCHLY